MRHKNLLLSGTILSLAMLSAAHADTVRLAQAQPPGQSEAKPEPAPAAPPAEQKPRPPQPPAAA
ncbi:MAG TPA: hypothetical protein VGE73_02420, partial [Pseudolabrys sp.]